jgi:hypothetical protein
MAEDKYTPADGEPVDMSEFTLGPRYGSEDMYRDYPNLAPGARVAFEKDGVVYTDVIESVRYQSPEWVAPPERSLWQRIVRRLTPPWLRKPLPQSPPKPASVTITVGDRAPDMKRAQGQIAKTLKAMEDLTNPPAAGLGGQP